MEDNQNTPELSYDDEMKIIIFSLAIVCFIGFICILNIELSKIPMFFAFCGILGMFVVGLGVFNLLKSALKKFVIWLQGYNGCFKKVLNFLVDSVYVIVMLIAILCTSVGTHY